MVPGVKANDEDPGKSFNNIVMTNQIPISVKIDAHIWCDLQAEINLGYQKRNRLINEAIDFYISYLEVKRSMKCTSDMDSRKKILDKFTSQIFPGLLT